MKTALKKTFILLFVLFKKIAKYKLFLTGSQR